MQYLTIRQHYIKKGDNVNLWRELYAPDTINRAPGSLASTVFRGRSKLADLIDNIPIIKDLARNKVQVDKEADAEVGSLIVDVSLSMQGLNMISYLLLSSSICGTRKLHFMPFHDAIKRQASVRLTTA